MRLQAMLEQHFDRPLHAVCSPATDPPVLTGHTASLPVLTGRAASHPPY
jgi:hypothetical protein